ncbi:uncharacterized protein SPPG_05983 [Spizellomyces punctatus DAOM BR117]|uniref:Peptidase A1 domain-containing protein n=1 Tax=Spizellomyces punctatus (strain DAOM BR117) TaxID=645134 RepID=A0A0L0HE46_SPIPD|nr:uncharacterized protein SPPG_05983 [Spizellomyces punctatus DAOM BR117]KNC99033.1 hypothetical protein SPPG_05983 [Spizellomyces punctatus DAOM BR117]|eukprot:XP_016607073.1 hypothetical protein SPPG_05983 [Spizellomyces punctatus DAOM BR117]
MPFWSLPATFTTLSLLLSTAFADPYHPPPPYEDYYRDEYPQDDYHPRILRVPLHKPDRHHSSILDRLLEEQAYIREKYSNHPAVRPAYLTPTYKEEKENPGYGHGYGYEQKYDEYDKYEKPKPKSKPKKKKGPVSVPAGFDPFDFIGQVEIGTPPQKLTVRFDTATQLSWVKKAAYKEKPKKYDDYNSYDKYDEYKKDNDYYEPERELVYFGFDPDKSSTWQDGGREGDLEYYGQEKVIVKEGRDVVNVGGIEATVTFGLRTQNEVSANETVDGHFGLSLRNPDLDFDPWLYQAVKDGVCDPIFALDPPPVEPPKAYAPQPTPSYGKRDQSYDYYEPPKPKPTTAQLSICGYEGQMPTRFNHVTQRGLQYGYWQLNLKKIKVGQSLVPLVKESREDPYGYQSYEPKQKEIDALIDTGSPFIMLPKIAVDKIHKLIGATCPGQEYGYSEYKDDYKDDYKKDYKDEKSTHSRRATSMNANSTSGFWRSQTGIKSHDLCTVPCASVPKLANITLTFDQGDYPILPAEYIQKDPDDYGKQQCYSVFTTFKPDSAVLKEAPSEFGEVLAVIGTSFTQAHQTVYYLGNIGQNRRRRRQLTEENSSEIPGIAITRYYSLAWSP